jgi:Protein of unknown function (DUF2917)
MILSTKRVVIEIGYQGVVPVEDAVGGRIDCLRGRIWLTEHGCSDDVVLEAGESYQIVRTGVVVVQALREALVALRAPEVAHAGRGFTAGVERLFFGWQGAHATGAHPGISPARDA